MPHKDPEKRKEANREKIRRYRERQKGLQDIVTPVDSVTPVTPETSQNVTPASFNDVTPVTPQPEVTSPIIFRLIDRQNDLEKSVEVLRQTVDALVEKVEDIASPPSRPLRTTNPKNESKSDYRLSDGELAFSKSRQSAGKLPKGWV